MKATESDDLLSNEVSFDYQDVKPKIKAFYNKYTGTKANCGAMRVQNRSIRGRQSLQFNQDPFAQPDMGQPSDPWAQPDMEEPTDPWADMEEPTDPWAQPDMDTPDYSMDYCYSPEMPDYSMDYSNYS